MISIKVNANDPYPLVDQIVDGIRRQIDERCLRPGTKLPSIRKFAEAYVCSPEVSWTGSYLNRLGSFVQALQTDSKGVSPFKVLRRLAKL